MKLLRIAQRCVRNGVSQHQLTQLQIAKTLSTDSFDIGKGDNQNSDSLEPTDVFERRIFGGMSSDSSNSFYQKLDRLQKARHGPGMDADFHGDRPSMFDGDGEDFSTLTDGMEGKLKKSATDFEINEEEVAQEDYSFRPDMNFKSGMTYTPRDLDLRKPGVWRPSKKSEFEVTTEEVLRKADFRNVRFLANFLTEAGIIIKRSKTGISAKAQRKVAREIKTARAFGLLPFTTMGTKPFVFGRTMEDLDHDFELENQERLAADEIQDVVEQ